MKVSRLRILSIVFLGSVSLLMAQEPAVTSNKDLLEVPVLSAETITTVRDALINQELTRSRMGDLAFTATLVGGLYWYYKWMSRGRAEDMVPVSEAIRIVRQQNDLNERLQKIEKGQPVPDTWAPWFRKKADSVGDMVYSVTPGLVWAYGRQYIFEQMSRVLAPVLPSFGNYFVQKPSVVWCLSKHSHFESSLAGYSNWIKGVISDPDNKNHAAELVSSTRQFVHEMEKVLGYMGFVLHRVEQKKSMVYKERGQATIDRIAREVHDLTQTVNECRALSEPTEDQMIAMIMFLRKSLVTIISQIENFESVALEAGVSEHGDSKIPLSTGEQTDIFTLYKRFVVSSHRPDAQPTQKGSEVMRRILLLVAQEYL